MPVIAISVAAAMFTSTGPAAVMAGPILSCGADAVIGGDAQSCVFYPSGSFSRLSIGWNETASGNLSLRWSRQTGERRAHALCEVKAGLLEGCESSSRSLCCVHFEGHGVGSPRLEGDFGETATGDVLRIEAIDPLCPPASCSVVPLAIAGHFEFSLQEIPPF